MTEYNDEPEYTGSCAFAIYGPPALCTCGACEINGYLRERLAAQQQEIERLRQMNQNLQATLRLYENPHVTMTVDRAEELDAAEARGAAQQEALARLLAELERILVTYGEVHGEWCSVYGDVRTALALVPPPAVNNQPKEMRIMADVSAELPKYKSHKTVWALRIAAMEPTQPVPSDGWDGSWMLSPLDAGYAPFKVDAEYIRKHLPHVGGYYVVYADGYKSFSPAEAFEEGYTRL